MPSNLRLPSNFVVPTTCNFSVGDVVPIPTLPDTVKLVPIPTLPDTVKLVSSITILPIIKLVRPTNIPEFNVAVPFVIEEPSITILSIVNLSAVKSTEDRLINLLLSSK